MEAFLLRYFPKYIKDLEFDCPRGPLKARLKHVKLVKYVYWENAETPHSNFWRLLVANKAKTIQDFKSTSDGGRYRTTFSKSAFQKLKLFPGRQKLFLYPPDSMESTEASSSSEFHYFERSCSYLGIMNNLRLLELLISGQKHLPILAKVNDFERILSHLKIFSLIYTLHNSQEYKFFQALLSYKTVLKNLRFLDLGVLARKEFFQVLRQLPTYCNQLHCLSFTTSRKEFIFSDGSPQIFDENTCLEDENYLHCLEDFKALKILRITSYHNLAFLQNAKLPPSLQLLNLDFSLFDWEYYENILDTSPFHHSLKNLRDLETLKLSFYRASNSEHPNEKYLYAKKSFIEGLLKNIPRLTQLTLAISRRYYFESEPTIDPISFDFSHFLACMSHFSDSLETLEVEDGADFFRFITESSLASLYFPKLSFLSITGKISDLDLGSVLGLVSHDVRLDKVVVESFKELLDVFIMVAKVKEIEKKQVQIKIDAKNIKEDQDDEKYLKENYEEAKKQIQGVNLKDVKL